LLLFIAIRDDKNKKPLRFRKRIKRLKNPWRIAKQEKVPRHSQKDRKTDDKIHERLMAIRV
jgi:hypothetical protein